MKTTPLPHLIHAEKHAAEIIAEARKRRNVLLKKAKIAAIDEVEMFTTEQEEALNKITAKINETLEITQRKVENATNEKIAQINEQATQNRDKVIDMLMTLMYEIKPEAHPNFLYLEESKKTDILDLIVAKRISESKLSVSMADSVHSVDTVRHVKDDKKLDILNLNVDEQQSGSNMSGSVAGSVHSETVRYVIEDKNADIWNVVVEEQKSESKLSGSGGGSKHSGEIR